MEGVRHREDTGFEGQCEYCRTWWPLDTEFWRPHAGLRRCEACWALYKREHEAGRRADEIVRLMKNTRGREAYYMNRPQRLESNRRWKAANRERVREYNREYRRRQAA